MEEGEEDSSSGEADLGGGAEEDMGDLGDFSYSGSSTDSEGDKSMEGAMAHDVGDRATTSLEGDVIDTGTSPSRGRQSFQQTTRCERHPAFIYAWSTFDTDGETLEAGTCDRVGRCKKSKHVGWARFSPASTVEINGGTDDGHYDAYCG